ncbi:OLC1v1027668C1 [Oldenlandia corymbosa var. corymbosa]|uniref:OLC1v1027668C1 n=1 Tax=Oldenlandia corymbosa var. corymbosa TaxID=529605 RepID=A0AAV1CCR2_OLDCO|nr:OLC1v1027668C1 [Oldenlandia corymbosa var. corymbosa]
MVEQQPAPAGRRQQVDPQGHQIGCRWGEKENHRTPRQRSLWATMARSPLTDLVSRVFKIWTRKAPNCHQFLGMSNCEMVSEEGDTSQPKLRPRNGCSLERRRHSTSKEIARGRQELHVDCPVNPTGLTVTVKTPERVAEPMPEDATGLEDIVITEEQLCEMEEDTEALSVVQKYLDWNFNTFGNIYNRNKRVLARLGGIQRARQHYTNLKLQWLEAELLAEMDEILQQEELLLIQKRVGIGYSMETKTLNDCVGSLWGERDEEARKMSGVAWEEACEPKEGPDAMKTLNGSTIFKSIKKVWSPLFEEVRWAINNGKIIKFWEDAWVVGSKPLREMALRPIPREQYGKTVVEFVSPEGQWDWSQFQSWLPASTILRTAATMPLSPANSDDRRILPESADGGFSTRVAYRRLEDIHNAPPPHCGKRFGIGRDRKDSKHASGWWRKGN